MTRALVLLASLAVLAPLAADASDRYDPRLRFLTISTPRFDIHYHQGEEGEARRLAAIAESVAMALDATLGRPSGRVQVILVDQTDLSNGWATPVPYNTIEIAAAAPVGESLLGNTSDWLRLVFAHEYTHIVHLSRGAGWVGGLRRVFGRMPLLYPNLFLPRWQIEGLAVHHESALTDQGRVPAGDFRSILGAASAASRLDPLDRLNGGLTDWPSGHAPYVYGGYFHEFLAAKYGEAALGQLADATAGRPPYFGARAFRKVFKQPLGELWDEFETASRRLVAPPAAGVTRLTDHGFNVGSPRFGPDGRLYYSTVNPHGFPALRARDLDRAASRQIANRYLGNKIGFAGARLVFDQVEIDNQVGLRSDLFLIELDGSHLRRLTDGARAADPDVSADGRTVVCTIQRSDRRELATLSIPAEVRQPAEPVALISEPGVQYGSPRWSPTGQWIAAERVPLGGRLEIVLIDPAARRIDRVVSHASRGRSVAPAWLPDGRLLYASDWEGDGFRIYATDVETRATLRLEGTGISASSPEPSRDGRTLVFVGYTVDGYDLFSIPLPSARWTPVDPAAGGTPGVAASDRQPALASPTISSKTYSPWRTLAPRSWTPTIESDSGELVIGAATATFDALARHAYAVEVGWSAERARPDWQVAYAYDRWWPTLFGNFADDTDPWRDGDVRTREVNAGMLLPFRRVRWSQSLLGAFHASTDEFACSECGPGGETSLTRRSVRAGWLLQASRIYGYSISREDGWSASMTLELTREALGADGDGGAATVDVRGYLPIAPRHAVLAARVAGAASWGDDRARRLFSASGSAPQPARFDFGSDAIGLLRGLDDDDVTGARAAVVNVDYRFPLMRFERGAGTLPVFARTLHGALFADFGHAWDSAFRREDVRVSIGGELSLDAVLGYALPLTFATGVAWVSENRGMLAFGRIGRAF
jgi:WD40-like Beta Propeller Repeat